MKKQFKRSKITGQSEEQFKGYIINLDSDVFNLFQYTNALPYSSGLTGGTGSAGAGKQYVELVIGTAKYKLLHDGTV
jgi:hypothetical protein